MKVIALISGGKDSTFNMMECVANGHEIVGLVNLRSKVGINNNPEIDSFMYQTVGSEIIDSYATAMDLPLYRCEIEGKPLNTDMEYEPSNEQDEVEDLYRYINLFYSILSYY
jgi:diphthine-ammonia ligase